MEIKYMRWINLATRVYDILCQKNFKKAEELYAKFEAAMDRLNIPHEVEKVKKRISDLLSLDEEPLYIAKKLKEEFLLSKFMENFENKSRDKKTLEIYIASLELDFESKKEEEGATAELDSLRKNLLSVINFSKIFNLKFIFFIMLFNYIIHICLIPFLF